MKSNRVELLSPAGNYESFLAAINAGADAVYVGGSQYSARAYAKNFSEEELLAAIDYAHLFGRKVFLTVNTLLKNQELEALSSYLVPFVSAGLDAVIVQDLGAISDIRKQFPDLPVHASTQMTITGAEGIRLLESYGVKRVVLARELSITEIQHITQHTKTETECFIHGAMCYSYSGKCLFSSLIGGRSGNRGRCAQPCRLPYEVSGIKNEHENRKEQYPLSLKDMCTLEILPQLIEAGIASFKIEGRMKRPEYVAGVTQIYRKYIDLYYQNQENYKLEKADLDELLKLYTRSGSSTGYYLQKNGRNMVTLLKPNYEMGEEERFQEIRKQYVEQSIKLHISGEVQMYVGKPAMLTVTGTFRHITGAASKMTVKANGPIVEASQNRPLEENSILKQLQKTGNTPFVFDQINIISDEGIFMPIKALNDLRRDALEQLTEQLIADYRRSMVKSEHIILNDYAKQFTDITTQADSCDSYLTAAVESFDVFQSLISIETIKDIYLGFKDREFFERAIELNQEYHKNLFISLPLICREHTMRELNAWKEQLLSAQISGVLVHNYESLQWLREQNYKKKIVSDFDLYALNHAAVEELHILGCSKCTASVELNEKELWHMNRSNMELVVYGYLPMMISAQCVQNTTKGCQKNVEAKTVLTDRYGKHLNMMKNCHACYNVIYNSVPLFLHSELDKIQKMCFESLRFQFTTETPDEATAIIRAFENSGKPNDLPASFGQYTKGHFARGVE